MAVVSFKSVGRTSTKIQIEKPAASPVPVGIATPVRGKVVDTDGIFAMHYDLSDQVKDNFRNLIETNYGERVGLYDFGANLQELVLEITSRDDFESEVMLRIKQAVEKWMPYVVLGGFELSNEFEDRNKTGIVKFTVTYDIPILNVTNQSIDVVLYVT